MAKTIKRVILLGAVLIMSMCVFIGCGDNYEYKESDFMLTIQLDKTKVIIGDTVTVTAKFENLSGRDVRLQMSHPSHKKLEDIVLAQLFKENDERRFEVTSVAGPRLKTTIVKDAVIISSIEIKALEPGNFELAAVAAFCVGKSFNNYLSINGNTIKIIISEEK